MNRRRFLSPLLLSVSALFIAAAPWQAEQTLKDSDMKKLAQSLGDWYDARVAEGDSTGAEAKFRKEFDRLNDKKLKDVEFLSLPTDLGRAIYLSNGYEKKKLRKEIGKIVMKSEKLGDTTIDFAIWTPPKYKAKSGPYPLIITIPAEGENPEKHISERWTNGDLKANAIIACPKMPGDSKLWNGSGGIGATLLTYRFVTETWAVDTNRVFLGGRERGGEAAVVIAEMFAKYFAGTFSWASDAGKGVNVENLLHVPVLILGGGNEAKALAERAKGVEGANVTVQAEGGDTEIFEWMGELNRANYPETVTIIQGATIPLPASAYWLAFNPVAPGGEARLDGSIDRETNTITLTGKGITDATVYFSDGMLDLSKPVKVIANGVEHVDQFERNVNQMLEYLAMSINDAGRVFVASKRYHLPALSDEESGDGEAGGEKDGE